MEKRLLEYRTKKQAKVTATASNFAHPPASNRSHILLTWLKALQTYITRSWIFCYISQALVNIPLIGKPLVLKFLLWLILFGLFVELEFGMVYMIASLFLLIYINTSTKRRTKNEVSAYSVFNKDFKKLDGTFTAEQFEKELTHRV